MKPAVLLLIGVAGVAGCSGDASGGSVDGPTIFATVCATCHGPTGKPLPQMVIQMNPRDLTAPEFRARVTKELVANQVRDGSANRRMPPLGTSLKPAQIDAVAAFVASPAFLTTPSP